MKLYYIYSLLMVAAIALNSCSDELSGTDWAPGEPSSAAGVYFDPDNETYMALLDGDGSVASLNVKRIDNKGELTVPVVVKDADANMLIPSTITFEDGSYETTLNVDCSTSPAIKELPIELTFPDEFINPYSEGSALYKGSVIVSRWENVSATGKTNVEIVGWNFADAGFTPFEQQMTHLLGSNRYRINDFLGTGVDFTFELLSSPLKDNYYRIMPVANQLLLSDYGWGDYSYYNSWWLISDDFYSDDEDAEGWPDVVLTRPNGTTTTIYYIQFLWYDDATKNEYCYVLNYDKGTPTAYMAFYGNLDEDMETYSSYYRVKFSWKEEVSND